MIWGRRDRGGRRADRRGRAGARRRSTRRPRYDEYDDYDRGPDDAYEYDEDDFLEDDEYEPGYEEERHPRRRRSSRRGSRRGYDREPPDFEDEYDEEPWEEEYDEGDEWEEPRPRRRAAAAGRRRRQPSRRPRRGEEPEEEGAWGRSLVGVPRSLLELSLPIFGCAAILPESEEHPQPDYERFRKEVLDAFTRFEEQALRAGYPTEDVMDARYALALFFDEAVQGSTWEGRLRWLGESLNALFNKDPAGGENFFHRLEELDRSRREVKEVFLACLAAGFNGKLAKLPPAEQGLERARLRREISRELVGRGEEGSSRVFPEAYVPAEPLENVVPPPPRWWMAVSVTVIVVCLLLYGILFWRAGKLAAEATTAIAGGGSGAPSAAVDAGGPGR